MKKPASRGKRISWKTLLSHKNLFSSKKKRPFPGYPVLGEQSYVGRYPKHEAFLEKNKERIKVFADIGCSFVAGAPTTIEAKKALGKGSKVYAVDVQKLHKKVKELLEEKNIETKVHSIVEKPLPFKCNAIRFANVSYFMTQSDRRKALVNIWKSLVEGGYLLGAHIQGYEEFEFILRKKGKWFELVYPKTLEAV